MSEGLDPVIRDSAVRIDHDHTCEVRPLVPELRSMARLVQEEWHDLTRLQAPAPERVAKSRLGKVRCEHPCVVTIALHRARIARHSVLSQALRALHDRARKVDPWYCRAFPECRLGRNAALAEGANSKLRQIAERANEAGCRDHVVDLERQRSPVARTLRLDTIALSSAFDTLDRRIEDDNAAV